MEAVNEKQRLFFWQFESNAFLSFFDKTHIAYQRTKLLGPFIAGDSATQRLEPSAVSAGQDDSPFVFALFVSASVDHASFPRNPTIQPVLGESIHEYTADSW